QTTFGSAGTATGSGVEAVPGFPVMWVGAVACGVAAVLVRYEDTSKRLVRLRKRKVKSGHSVVLFPCLSRYQLAHPPVFHTEELSLLCSSRLYSSCASRRTSTVRSPRRSMVASASAM